MRVDSLSLGFVLVFLLFVFSFCNAESDHQKFEIVGFAECADCQQNNFKISHAFSGLHVTIDCKLEKGIKRVGDGEVDEGGKFKISLPEDIIGDVQNLKKKKCYAQLHSAAAVPCPAHGGLEATEIVFKSQINKKVVFTPAKALRFTTASCTSKFLWPFFDYPPLPKTDPWKKDWPEITVPPLPPTFKPKPKPFYKPPIFKPLPPPFPTYKPKPKPKPSVPIYKPPTKPIPPPFYKPIPKPPVVKPLPPPVPVYKPLPPPVPIYKPPVPIYKPPVVKPLPPPVPIYEPPVVTKPLPPPFPLFPLPPLYKKPCPPFAKIPPKYFDHPKFGNFPKLPPFNNPNYP